MNVLEDLVDAHLRVASSLQGGQSLSYNLGIGRGYSVGAIIDAARSVVGRPFAVERGPRRSGDPPALFADASKIQRDLGWVAKQVDIRRIIASAWR